MMMTKIIFNKLSSKLLLLTVLFVMVAEMLIFIPSAAMYRHNYLAERAQAAGLLTLAIEGVPDYKSGKILSDQFMHDTDVSMVVQMRVGKDGQTMRQLVLGDLLSLDKAVVYDLRNTMGFPPLKPTFMDFFGRGEGYIRILSHPTVDGVKSIETVIPRFALKMALTDYCHRILLLSLFLSLLTGLMIYWVLSWLIVRPVQKLANELEQFRTDPKKYLDARSQKVRHDEIGQLEREFYAMKDGVRGALKQQERLATLGMAMTKINHDLRNVLGAAQLISDRLAEDKEERIRKMGKRLVKAVERGVTICQATLNFAQSVEERPVLQSVNLYELIQDVLEQQNNVPINGKSMVQFSNEIPRQVLVKVDPAHTERIFDNLFRNAISAMQDNPTFDQAAMLEVFGETAPSKISIYIRDNAGGLPRQARQNLFKAFTSSTRKGGTGLGLTIARELARAQGGNLRLKSSDASGTVFLLELTVFESAKIETSEPFL